MATKNDENKIEGIFLTDSKDTSTLKSNDGIDGFFLTPSNGLKSEIRSYDRTRVSMGELTKTRISNESTNIVTSENNKADT